MIGEPVPPHRRRTGVGPQLGLHGQGLQRLLMLSRERRSAALQPPFQLRVVRQEEAVQQGAGVERGGPLQLAPPPRGGDVPEIAGDAVGVEAQVARSGDQVVGAQPAANRVGQLVQAVSGAIGRGLRPEERD